MNRNFTAFDPATGQVLFGGSAYDPEAMETAQCSILLDVDYRTGWLEAGIHHEQPEQPSPHHVFNWVTKQWQDPRTLADLKAMQWALIKQARAAEIASPLVTPYGTFDADAHSRTAITDSVLLLQTLSKRGQPQTIRFTLADNTDIDLSVSQIEEVGLMLGEKTNAAFAKGRLLREAIEAAAKPEQVAEVVW